MMDSNVKSTDVDDFFKQYATPAPKPEKSEYQPFKSSGTNQKRLKCIRADGSASFLSYQFLIRFILASPDTILTLIFSDVIITLEGENLGQLAEHLQEEKIKSIACFNPEIHDRPDADTPCITAIIEQSPKEFAL